MILIPDILLKGAVYERILLGTVLILYLKDYTNYTFLHRHSHIYMYTFPPAIESSVSQEGGESEKHRISENVILKMSLLRLKVEI